MFSFWFVVPKKCKFIQKKFKKGLDVVDKGKWRCYNIVNKL
jgi:hypothetical protein